MECRRPRAPPAARPAPDHRRQRQHRLCGGVQPRWPHAGQRQAIDGTVRLWNVADPAHPRPLGQPLTIGSGSAVSAVAFSPDGRTLASGNADGTVRLWNVADPAHPRPLGQPLTSGSGNVVYSVAFSPDGRTLASGNGDGTVRLWNVADPAHPQPLGQPLTNGSINAVSAVAFSPDGRTLASGNDDGTVRLWSLPLTVLTSATRRCGGVQPRRPHAGQRQRRRHGPAVECRRPRAPPAARPAPDHRQRRAVYAVAFSPDGRTLASGNDDGTVRLWNVADPAHPRPLGQPLTSGSRQRHRRPFAVAFSPDGHTLASGSSDGTVRLWNVADPAHPRPLGQPLTSGASNGVSAVAFSPDGRTLASGNGDGTVRLWNVADPAHPRPLGQPLTIGSPRGRPAATSSMRWRSAPMATPWPAATTTARSGCGMSPTPRTPGRSASP